MNATWTRHSAEGVNFSGWPIGEGSMDDVTTTRKFKKIIKINQGFVQLLLFVSNRFHLNVLLGPAEMLTGVRLWILLLVLPSPTLAVGRTKGRV